MLRLQFFALLLLSALLMHRNALKQIGTYHRAEAVSFSTLSALRNPIQAGSDEELLKLKPP
jgi:hypothetical protein